MEENKFIGTRVPLRTLAEIEKIMKRRKATQSEVVRMLLDVGIECHKDMDRVGLIGVVDFAYFVRESIKEKLANKQLKLF